MRNHITRTILGVLAAFTLCSCQSTPYDEAELLTPDENSQVDFETPEQAFTYREGGDSNLCFFRDLPSAKLEVHNGHIYYHNGKTMIRYNPVTNVQTTLCEDSLCTHDNEQCPFYGYDATMRFTVFENNIVFRRSYMYSDYTNSIAKESSVVKYNMENHQISVLRELTGNILSNGTDIYLGDKYLYVDIIYDEENSQKICQLCLKDLKNNTTQILREDKERQLFSPMYVYDGYIYYKNTLEHTLYVAPVNDPASMIPLAQAPSSPMLNVVDQSVYALNTENGNITYSTAPDECSPIPGIEGADYFYITDNYIYYRKVYDTVNHTSFYGEPVTTSLREYYRCNHDGKNHELVYREEPHEDEYTIFMGDFVVLGDYIYTRWSQKILVGENTENSDRSTASTIARYDIETGEWYYIMNE